MAFAEDMSAFFNAADFALTAVWGAYSASVMLDKPDEDILGGRAVSTDYVATIAAADFPGIARGAAITVEGVAYTVRESKLVGDGMIKTLSLSKT